MTEVFIFMPRGASDAKKEKMLTVIKKLVEQGIYPSAARISKGMGRNTKTLNGPECVTRREIFKQLGIKLKRSGWVDRHTQWLEEFRGSY